jgi:hypothetical protein
MLPNSRLKPCAQGFYGIEAKKINGVTRGHFPPILLWNAGHL